MAYGNMAGLVIVDIVQHLCLLNMGTADLYGAAGNRHYEKGQRIRVVQCIHYEAYCNKYSKYFYD